MIGIKINAKEMIKLIYITIIYIGICFFVAYPSRILRKRKVIRFSKNIQTRRAKRT